jgi:hypothetical protein
VLIVMSAYQQSKHIYFECFHQIENEYGSYNTRDSKLHNNTTLLKDIVESIMGDIAVFYSTDWRWLSWEN